MADSKSETVSSSDEEATTYRRSTWMLARTEIPELLFSFYRILKVLHNFILSHPNSGFVFVGNSLSMFWYYLWQEPDLRHRIRLLPCSVHRELRDCERPTVITFLRKSLCQDLVPHTDTNRDWVSGRKKNLHRRLYPFR